MDLRIERRHTSELRPAERSLAQALLDRVFRGEFDPTDWDHALGGVHVLAWRGEELVGHVSVVQRCLLHRGRPLRVGYVEALGVRADLQRLGIGGRLMEEAERIVAAAYDLGALSASEQAEALYERRGWRRFEGQSAVLGPEGQIPTPEEDGGIWLFAPARELDLGGELVCEPRCGDVW